MAPVLCRQGASPLSAHSGRCGGRPRRGSRRSGPPSPKLPPRKHGITVQLWNFLCSSGFEVKAQGSQTDSHHVTDDALVLALARAIRAERGRAGLTQAQLAERLGIKPVTVSAIETVTRRIYADELPAICDALGVTLDQLLFRAPDNARRRLGFNPQP